MNKNQPHSLIIIYVWAISIWFGLWLWLGDGFWWLTLINMRVPYLFVPAPLIIYLAVRSHRKGLIALSLIPPLVFGFLYWPYLTPRAVPRDAASNLRVMTYNVLFSNDDYDAVARVILTRHPDLVGLQEVTPEMMSELTGRLDEAYPYSLLGHEHPYGTTAILSRHPLVDSYILDLEVDRPAIVVKVQIDDQQVTFVSTHLTAYGWRWIVQSLQISGLINQRTAEQNRQAHILLEDLEKIEGSVIVACDCNSRETSSSYRMLTTTLSNAARATGWSIGAPAPAGARQDRNLQHIDYVLYRGALTPVNVYAIQSDGGSDHLPILALFATN